MDDINSQLSYRSLRLIDTTVLTLCSCDMSLAVLTLCSYDMSLAVLTNTHLRVYL